MQESNFALAAVDEVIGQVADHVGGQYAYPAGDRGDPGYGGPELGHFDDGDWRRSAPRMQQHGQLQIASDLASARTSAERTRLVGAMLNLIGFTEVAYLMARLDAHDQFERVYFARSFQSGHLAPRYFEAGDHRGDPRMQAVLSRGAPHVWDLQTLTEAWRRAGSPGRLRATIDRSLAQGAGSGAMFSIPIPQTRLCSIISFASPVTQAAWITDAVIAQALALGLSLHQHCSPIVRALERGATQANLSDVQTRILSFVAVGLSDKEIAMRMRTTPHNIDYHLRRLRQKCGVSSREELAFLAGQLLRA